ncbi:MAG: hypothetical protein IJ035_05635 [Oscillospiraceae bacterium]|nr:hypothetical protein [Oscillospiraceae bacterium]
MSDLYNTEEMENNSASLVDDFQLDEMQKAENYKIGFQMFKILFYIVMFISYTMFIISSKGNTAIMVLSFVLYACGWTVYIIYAAKASAKGVMNPTFVRNNTRDWQPFVYVCFALMIIIFALCDLFHIYQAVILVFTMAMLIVINYFAKRNIKVMEKQLEEDGE